MGGGNNIVECKYMHSIAIIPSYPKADTRMAHSNQLIALTLR